MNHSNMNWLHDRRTLLTGGLAAIGGLTIFGNPAAAAASLFAPPAQDGGDSEDPLLVVIQLAGGNDGLCTIVPYAEDDYHAARNTTRVFSEEVLKIDDYRGFNPLLSGMRSLWDRGELAIVEGVGYENPNRSHFSSFDIWHAASDLGTAGGYGWLARLGVQLRKGDAGDANIAVHVGDRLPYSLVMPEASGVCFRDPGQYQWDRNGASICEAVDGVGMSGGANMSRVRRTFLKARDSSAVVRAAVDTYKPKVEYPDNSLGKSLSIVAALASGGIGARILSVELDGFDTHSGQRARHDDLLRTLDSGLTAFLEDLRGTPVGARTTVLVFSEFGRRVVENASIGTDHGTAGPLFVAGAAVKGGLYGKHPSLQDLDEGDLKFTNDFRGVYSTLIQDWFQRDAEALLGAQYSTLPLFA